MAQDLQLELISYSRRNKFYINKVGFIIQLDVMFYKRIEKKM